MCLNTVTFEDYSDTTDSDLVIKPTNESPKRKRKRIIRKRISRPKNISLDSSGTEGESIHLPNPEIVPLYQRENGSFILHRIVKVEKDGTYTCAGDGQTSLETGVRQEQVIAVVQSFTRKGKKISCQNKGYQLYAQIWTMLLPIRPILLQMIKRIGKGKQLLLKLKNKRKHQ